MKKSQPEQLSFIPQIETNLGDGRSLTGEMDNVPKQSRANKRITPQQNKETVTEELTETSKKLAKNTASCQTRKERVAKGAKISKGKQVQLNQLLEQPLKNVIPGLNIILDAGSLKEVLEHLEKADYRKTVTGGGLQLLQLYINERKHKNNMEKLSLIMGFIIVMCFLLVSCYLVIAGHNFAGTTIGAFDMASIVSAFVLRKRFNLQGKQPSKENNK